MEIAPGQRILSAENLVVKFNLRGQTLTALRSVTLDLYKGESLAIVGESGSGKSVFTKSFLGLLDNNGWIDQGHIYFDRDPAVHDYAESNRGVLYRMDLATFKRESEWLPVRGKRIAMIFQDPMTSLNPLRTIGKQIGEAYKLHHKCTAAEEKRRVLELLADVGIQDPEMRIKQYPHEFSGGMRQRVVIAIAMACNPEILICDEPTTALDVTIQAQILSLLKRLQREHQLTVVYITHDLGVVANVADRVAVMYAGDVVELGTCAEVFHDPRHPYTIALLLSLPQLGVRGEELYSIPGSPPNLFTEIRGDAFAARNVNALKADFVERPPYFAVSPTHKARTWLLDPRAPKVAPPPQLRNIKNLSHLRLDGGITK
ncbi:MAG: ABC transporter ATP-binding protein [Oscillospiraceae bacterium]|jgi:oligopeptide transport system ATP-binding protein|nr:ABC transporter ATP-binding protein [Oscillospiraceae bacterium]